VTSQRSSRSVLVGAIVIGQRDADAALSGQEIHRLAHGRIIHPVDDLASTPLLDNQAGIDQGPQMVGERGGSLTKVEANVTDVQARIARPHEQPVDGKARFVAKGS
jgi:hypothetical protein